MTEVITDKYGKRVTRPDGVLQDGDTMRVKLSLMDAQNPGLAAAAALADSVRRSEVFDMKIHGQTARYGTTADASVSAREARDQRLRDAWAKPPPVVMTGNEGTASERVAVVGPNAPKEQLFAARDAAVAARDKRLESAWAK